MYACMSVCALARESVDIVQLGELFLTITSSPGGKPRISLVTRSEADVAFFAVLSQRLRLLPVFVLFLKWRRGRRRKGRRRMGRRGMRRRRRSCVRNLFGHNLLVRCVTGCPSSTIPPPSPCFAADHYCHLRSLSALYLLVGLLLLILLILVLLPLTGPHRTTRLLALLVLVLVLLSY
jgi:hypothetical protein